MPEPEVEELVPRSKVWRQLAVLEVPEEPEEAWAPGEGELLMRSLPT